MNCVYYGIALKLALRLRKGKILQSWVSIRCINTNWSPLNKYNKLAESVNLSEKYIHSVYHVSISNITLFLRTLVINFLPADIPSLLQQVDCYFQKRSTNRLWTYKMSGSISWILVLPDSSIYMEFFHGIMVVCDLRFIIFVLLSMKKYKTLSSP